MQKNVRICKVSDIPESGMKDFTIEDGSTVLVANFNKNYYAYGGLCPIRAPVFPKAFMMARC